MPVVTRSQTIKPFHAVCSSCNKSNCCKHKPLQVEYNKALFIKTVSSILHEMENVDSYHVSKDKALLGNKMFTYIISNLQFMKIHKKFNKTACDKLKEFNNNPRDVRLLGVEELKYYTYWLNSVK